MTLTPRRKCLLAAVAVIYLAGITIEGKKNYDFSPTEETIRHHLENKCQLYYLDINEFTLAEEPTITRRVLSASYWHGIFRNRAGTTELEIIINSKGETYSTVNDLVPQEPH